MEPMVFTIIASIAAVASAFISLLMYRHVIRTRRDDIADKKQLIHGGIYHSWPSPKATPENEVVHLTIANRAPHPVTIKEVVWFICMTPTVWAMAQRNTGIQVSYPVKLEPSDEITLAIDVKNIFHIPWLNQAVPWYDKVFFIKSVRACVTLTTGQEYCYPLPVSLRRALVARQVNNALFRLVGCWYASR